MSFSFGLFKGWAKEAVKKEIPKLLNKYGEITIKDITDYVRLGYDLVKKNQEHTVPAEVEEIEKIEAELVES